MTLEQLENQIDRLSYQEKLDLLEYLSASVKIVEPEDVMVTDQADDDVDDYESRRKEADELIARLDKVAMLSADDPPSDSAAEIRQMRADRDNQICPS